MPTRQRLLEQFLQLADDGESSIADLAAIVADDPAFAAHILTISTSASHPMGGAVCIEQSLAHLGKPLLRTVACCLAVQNSRNQQYFSRSLDHGGFCCHSLLVAFLARTLAEEIGYPCPEEAYLAGLLHDIGQLLIVGGIAEYAQILAAGKQPNGGGGAVAQLVERMSPEAVGASLVEGWRLDSFMADAILFHRFPAEQMHGADTLCRTLWAAHRLATCVESGDSDLAPIPHLLGIESTKLAWVCRAAGEWLTERGQLLGISSGGTGKAKQERSFISPELTLPEADIAPPHSHLLWNLAAMQPLQEATLSSPDEGELYASLGLAATLLYGLPRPLFLRRHQSRPILTAAATSGLPPLLQRLEIPLDPSLSLAAEALETSSPAALLDVGATPQPRLADLQLARQLGSRGLLCIPMGSTARECGVMVFSLSRKQYAAKRQMLNPLSDFARLGERCIGQLRAMRQREERLAAELTNSFEQNARRVIHEAANPLGILNNYLQILAERVGDTAEVQQELAILKEEIFRVERIVRRLGDQPERPTAAESVNVNALIDGMLALYGESLFESRGIRVEREQYHGLPLMVSGDRDSLKQILLNLWKNASEALEEGGTMRIATRLLAQGGAPPEVEIVVGDTGPGIPPEVMDRLFQPIPTERSSANSGVGLSIVSSLVERLGGRIECQSSPGYGTSFTISLALGQKDMP